MCSSVLSVLATFGYWWDYQQDIFYLFCNFNSTGHFGSDLLGSVWTGHVTPTVATNIWAATWQNQQNDMCAQRRLRSTWASAQSDQSSLYAWRKLGSLATHRAHSEDWSEWADAQADLSLRWAHSHFVVFVMSRLSYGFVSIARS